MCLKLSDLVTKTSTWGAFQGKQFADLDDFTGWRGRACVWIIYCYEERDECPKVRSSG
jgi:hypothetical protein